jgi:hypothetical protein
MNSASFTLEPMLSCLPVVKSRRLFYSTCVDLSDGGVDAMDIMPAPEANSYSCKRG